MTNVQIAAAGIMALAAVLFIACIAYVWRLIREAVNEEVEERCAQETELLRTKAEEQARLLQERFDRSMQDGREQIRQEREKAKAESRREFARRAREADVREWELTDRADRLERRKRDMDAGEQDLRRRTSALDLKERSLDRREAEQAFRLRQDAEKAEAALQMKATFLDERLKGYPSAAMLWAEFTTRIYGEAERWLLDGKRPAPAKAEVVRELRRRARDAERRTFMWKGLAGAYEDLMPALAELRESPDDFAPPAPDADDGKDPARRRLTDAEWAALKPQERFQLALDRWKKRRRTAWEAGREYERSVGWRLERDGWNVSYDGALKGKEDLGRDLVAKKLGRTLVIQCKRWSAEKTVHEKHVLQTFGTCVLYDIEHGLAPGCRCRGVLACTCGVSDTAKACAERLGIEIWENYPMEDYPLVKCNIGRGGERIYHLPFDQQYDRVKITVSKGERFCWTVQEAEDKGFRRAFRWHGDGGGGAGGNVVVCP